METKEALQKMNALDDNQWNTDGTVKLAAVRAIAGNNAITREEVAAVAPEFTRENPFINEAVKRDNTVALAELMEETKLALDESRVRLATEQANQAMLSQKLDHFMEEDAKLNPTKSTTHVIQDYLARQRSDLKEKGEQVRRLKESGINMKELSKLLS